jgi:16S rRNA (cytidine1402-2'-O)-methyltransferase
MNSGKSELAPGLYLVATPIGNARDITLRALDILRDADVLAAEDTRSLRRLMEIHGVALGDRPLVAYHEHNGDRARPRLLAEIAEGRAVAYASEAGTPLISDPGFDLVRTAREAGLAVTTAPGAVAAVAALTLSALPTDRFLFAGFLPASASARKKALKDLAGVKATVVLYESPRRLGACLGDASAIMGADRPAVVCREITKKFEETRRGTLSDLAEFYAENAPKGEIVLLIGKGDSETVHSFDLETEVRAALGEMSVRDVADVLSEKLGVKRRTVYQMAMRIDGKDNGEDKG